jgi:hypothetical protein
LTDINTNKDLEKGLKDAKLYYRLHEHLCSLHLSTTTNVFSTFKDSIDIFKEFAVQKARVFDREQSGKSKLEDIISKKLVISSPFVEEKYRKNEEGIKKRIRDYFKDPLQQENKRDFEVVSFNNADVKEIERNASAIRASSPVKPTQKKKTNLQRKVSEGIVQRCFVSIAAAPSAAAVNKSEQETSQLARYCQAADLTWVVDMHIKGMGNCSSRRHSLLRQRAAGA